MEKREETHLPPATNSGLRPADFPLGSLESRAAVRVLLTMESNQTRRSQCDAYPSRWSPETAAQKAALESAADILLFGGAAGGVEAKVRAVPITDANTAQSVIEKFREKYGAKDCRSIIRNSMWRLASSWAENSRINHVANDDAECSAPVELAEIQNRLFL